MEVKPRNPKTAKRNERRKLHPTPSDLRKKAERKKRFAAFNNHNVVEETRTVKERLGPPVVSEHPQPPQQRTSVFERLGPQTSRAHNIVNHMQRLDKLRFPRETSSNADSGRPTSTAEAPPAKADSGQPLPTAEVTKEGDIEEEQQEDILDIFGEPCV